ncbi:hypothetical protein G7046_g2507 [Stylonectria norvegica]|nr:hypothetical protein G7046_g2507 [Stylonectria norvegica]
MDAEHDDVTTCNPPSRERRKTLEPALLMQKYKHPRNLVLQNENPTENSNLATQQQLLHPTNSHLHHCLPLPIMAITSAIADLFNSFYELLASILGTAYAIVHSIVAAITGLVTGFFNLIANVLSGLVEVTGGVGKFVASNIVLLSIGALAAFAYVRYTASGQRAVASKKTQ